MEHIYPAIFHVNNDGSYTITFPDLPGCISEGKSLGNALSMAQSALNQWIEYLTDKRQEIPQASGIGAIRAGEDEFVNLIRADLRACSMSSNLLAFSLCRSPKLGHLCETLNRL